MSHDGRLSVLLVSANYRPSVGGIERFTETLAEGLAARGHRVEVICCRHARAPLRESLNNVTIRRVPSSTLLHRRLGIPWPVPSPVSLRRAMREAVAEADIVHAQDAIYVTTGAALRAAAREGVPSVLTQHVGFVPQKRRLLDLAQHAAIATLGRVSRRATAVTTVSDAVADWAADTWRLERPRTFPVGVEPPVATSEERRAIRLELGAGDDDVVALFAGRDVPKKRLDLFLGAADPARYLLVAVTDRADSQVEGVRLVPFVDPSRFRTILASCDIFVLPSHAEGFPLSLQEALAAGVPCVITAQAGYERYLGPDDVELVTPDPERLRETLRQLAADPARRALLGARGQAIAERHFGVTGYIDAYEGLYRDLVRARQDG